MVDSALGGLRPLNAELSQNHGGTGSLVPFPHFISPILLKPNPNLLLGLKRTVAEHLVSALSLEFTIIQHSSSWMEFPVSAIPFSTRGRLCPPLRRNGSRSRSGMWCLRKTH